MTKKASARKTTLKAIKNKMFDLDKNKQTIPEKDVPSLKTKLNALPDLTKIQAELKLPDLTKIQDELKPLNLRKIQADLKKLQSVVNINDINKLNSSLNKLKSDTNKLNPSLNKLKSDTNKLNPSLGNLKTDINKLPNFEKLQKNFGQLKSDLAKVKWKEVQTLPKQIYDSLKPYDSDTLKYDVGALSWVEKTYENVDY